MNRIKTEETQTQNRILLEQKNSLKTKIVEEVLKKYQPNFILR